jgi:hypothetical protein
MTKLIDALAKGAYEAYIEQFTKCQCGNYFGVEEPVPFGQLKKISKNAWRDVVKVVLATSSEAEVE